MCELPAPAPAPTAHSLNSFEVNCLLDVPHCPVELERHIITAHDLRARSRVRTR